MPRPSQAKAKAKKPTIATAAPPRPRPGAPGPGPSGPYLGQIRLLPYGFAPTGWAPCDGRIMAIRENLPLFLLIRTTYGGNGASTFALPNLPPRGPSGPYYYIAITGLSPS